MASASRLLQHARGGADGSGGVGGVYDISAVHSKRSMAAVIKSMAEEQKTATILNEVRTLQIIPIVYIYIVTTLCILLCMYIYSLS